MKYTHFDDIKPNNKIDFITLYFAVCRFLRKLEALVRRINNGNQNCKQAWLFRRLQRKLSQMAAKQKVSKK